MSIFGSGETPLEKYARLGSAYTQTTSTNTRDIGQTASNFLKPDGNPILQIASATANIVTGSARQITKAFTSGATILTDKGQSWEPDPTKIAPIAMTFIRPPGGPPYENVLEQFATYSPVWTLSCLEPSEFNNPQSYRNNPAGLRNVILSSAGRYDAQRTNTTNGKPEYFIDNVQMKHNVAPGAKDGNTNNFNFTFDVYEPYSMGLFLQSLKVAAVNAGYPSYLEVTPYLLMLEFKGMKDNGAIFGSTKTLTKFFTIRINKVEFKVDEGGSRYNITAMPLHYSGFSDLVNILPNEISITGETCKSILSSGSRSLCNALNRIQQLAVKNGQQEVADVYQIVFPLDASDPVGVDQSTSSTDVLRATADPNKQTAKKIGDTSDELQLDFGSGPIGADKNTMGFDATSGGNYVFKYESDVVDEKGQKVDKEKMSIDTNLRLFTFPQGEKISQVIHRIILSSKFAENAIKPEAIVDGFVEWYRLDCQIQLLDYDSKRNVRAKKYVYRIVPYDVNAGVFKNPNAAPDGHAKLNKVIAKRYDYIYTGTNNDLLKFDIQFNSLWYQGQMPTAPNNNATIANKDLNAGTDEKRNQAVVQSGEAASGVSATSGGASLKPDYNIPTGTASGDKTVEQVIADAFNHAFLQSGSKDLANVNIDILGDPYFISDSGLNSNHFAEKGPNKQVNADSSMNWEGSEIFVYISWRSPVEPNLGTAGRGGLYNFPKGEWVSPFSGIYKVQYVNSKFTGGTFQQTLELMRLQGQSNDFIDGSETVNKQTQMLYNTSLEERPRTSVVDYSDPMDEDPLGAPAPSSASTPSEPGTGRTINIDIRAEQQEARVAAYLQARAAGQSEEQAQNISATVGNNVGAAALSREFTRSGL